MKPGRVALLLALSAAMVAPSQATHIVITLPAPSIYIAVGSLGATIDAVTFPLGAQPVGTPIPQLEAAVLVEIAYIRGGGDPNRVYVTMTPSPATGLTDGFVNVPWTQFSWTSSNTAEIPSGTFTGAANQPLVDFVGGVGTARRREASLTYQYANTAPVANGTYSGRVTFTATTP